MAFEVKGLPILVDEIEVLRTLREQVYEKTGKEILRKIKRSGNNIMICCPHHNDGQERKPSCGVSLVARRGYPIGTVHCFACNYTNSLAGMISNCFGFEGEEYGTNWLIENFVTGETYERPDIISDFSRGITKPKISYITEEELAKYRFYHPYMWQRKLTPEIVEKYDVGYQKDFRFESTDENGQTKYWPPMECLTFPVRDINGNCLFVSRRAIHDKTFFLPLNIDKPVYGVYELPKNCSNAVICESVFNALTCVAYGRPALALFGTGTQEQYEILNKLDIRHYTIGLDPDRAGQKGTWKLKKYLKNKMLTKLIIPEGKDINDLSYEEFTHLNEIYF